MSQDPPPQASDLYGEPLQDGYIRVVRLLPTEQTSCAQNDIIGELEEIPLPSSTSHTQSFRYDSLSYCWGQDGVGRKKELKFRRRKSDSSEAVTGIVCVTQSVENALQQLRLYYGLLINENEEGREARYNQDGGDNKMNEKDTEEELPSTWQSRRLSPRLWIDQICINQRSKEEKSQQIGIMARIYEMSSTVLIWLGLKTGTSERAIECLKEISEAFVAGNIPDGYGYKSEKAQAVQQLLNRPWFERAWTLQEAANAKDCKVLCGTETFDYDLLHQFYSGCQSQQSRQWREIIEYIVTAGPTSMPNDERAPLAHILTIAKFKEIRERERMRNNDAGSTGSALMQFNRLRNCKTQHASDKIFSAWYNLPQTIKSTVGNPDYETPVEEIYRRVAEAHLCREGDIMYLAGAGIYRRNLALPSWVPDYTHPETHYSFAVLDEDCLHRTGEHLFHATHAQGAPARVSKDGRTLKLKARILGNVSGMTQPFYLSAGNDLNPEDRLNLLMKETRQHLENCERLVGHEQLDQSEHESLTALRRTLTCDMEVLNGGPSFGCVFVPAPVHNVDQRFDALKRCVEASERMTAGPVVTSHRKLPDRRLDGGGEEEGGLQIMVHNITMTAARINVTAAYQSSEQAHAVMYPFVAACDGRVFFVTEDHHMGLAPSVTRPGDKVCVIYGSQVPFIVRPIEVRKIKMSDDELVKAQCYILVGECYAHGFMNGEAVKESIAETDDLYLI